MEITLKEVEAVRLNLQPGDTLAITIKSDDLDEETIGSLRDNLKEALPGIKVALFGIGLDGDIKFSVIKEESIGCGTQSYCIDCNCGKKEMSEIEGVVV